ncbi:type II toxin-antitoxin system RelE/ParE family toxin [aff. Roholtiella sp. LEGE 12411]|uniref:type II toxin-antitoxin system RelE/ParE family toxin n=1 Tax=aff. Roholtiella sp. LEGE 12411 TaxID=1828822 RepID=UPI00187E6B91|nr:type II toxin-antitoxin system RelE/ParE family toxin [aff. Roholtiella sp. LEGE 12411]MBE9036011.1 type II toxin-antitoxin system RelE/ParE family toxin [aff. Roholtiella sp. LEGE 12411]
MKQLRVTDQAKTDLIDIWLYISQNNESAADTLIDKITGKFDELLANPGMGRERIDIVPLVRSFPVSNYLIFYRLIEQGIEIVRVIHGARNIPNLFE